MPSPITAPHHRQGERAQASPRKGVQWVRVSVVVPGRPTALGSMSEPSLPNRSGARRLHFHLHSPAFI